MLYEFVNEPVNFASSRKSLLSILKYMIFLLSGKTEPVGYLTQNLRIGSGKKSIVPLNNKATVFDLTENGVMKLVLCIISFPASDKPGNTYLQMTNSKTVSKFVTSSLKK